MLFGLLHQILLDIPLWSAHFLLLLFYIEFLYRIKKSSHWDYFYTGLFIFISCYHFTTSRVSCQALCTNFIIFLNIFLVSFPQIFTPQESLLTCVTGVSKTSKSCHIGPGPTSFLSPPLRGAYRSNLHLRLSPAPWCATSSHLGQPAILAATTRPFFMLVYEAIFLAFATCSKLKQIVAENPVSLKQRDKPVNSG